MAFFSCHLIDNRDIIALLTNKFLGKKCGLKAMADLRDDDTVIKAGLTKGDITRPSTFSVNLPTIIYQG